MGATKSVVRALATAVIVVAAALSMDAEKR